jgi:hypothetical protein
LFNYLEFISLYISLLPIIVFLFRPSKEGFTLRMLVLFLSLCSFEIDMFSCIVVHFKQSNHTLIGIFNVLSSLVYSALIYQLMKANKFAVIFTIFNLGTFALLFAGCFISMNLLTNSSVYFIFSLLMIVESLFIYRQTLLSYLRTSSWNTSKFLITTGIFFNFSLSIVVTLFFSITSDLTLLPAGEFTYILIFQFLANITQYILFSFALWKIPS